MRARHAKRRDGFAVVLPTRRLNAISVRLCCGDYTTINALASRYNTSMSKVMAALLHNVALPALVENPELMEDMQK